MATLKKEWARADMIYEQFGIGRTPLERLAQQGEIKSVVIKIKPSSRRTTRLYSVQSIREFLDKLASHV